MVVLGIDPGSRRCGYGVVARTGTRLSRVASGVLVPGSELPMAERLARILEGLGRVIAGSGIDAVAVETAYCGRSARAALALGQARGVALAAAAGAGLPVFEYVPGEVKRAFTGNGRADKEQMVRTARTLFGLDARLADEADALAIAVCHLARGPVAWPAVRRAPGPGAGRAVVAPEERARRALRPAVRRFGEGR